MILVQIDSGEARNLLAEAGRIAGNPRAVLGAAAGGLLRLLRRHFEQRNKTPNKLGGRRTDFWNQVRSSTQIGEVTDRQADVVIGHAAFRQKLSGGTIRAKTPWKSGIKLLTIPVVGEAHGRRASVLRRELGIKLFFVGDGGGGVLAARADGAGLKVYYACKPEVTQAPDPNALPPRGELERVAVEAGEKHVRDLLDGGEGNQ